MPSKTQIARAWLIVYRSAVPMRTRAIVETFAPAEQSSVAKGIQKAYMRGLFERTGGMQKYAYEVTPGCGVPFGVTVKDILEAKK